LHIVVARARGARVFLSEPSPIRREMAAAFNPEATFDPSKEDVVARVRESTNGVGVSIAVCANPVAATHTQAVELVRKRGKVVLFGGLPKANPISTIDGNRVHYDEIEVLGSFSYLPAIHSLALNTISRGLVPVDQIVTHTFTIDQIDDAFQTATSGEALKVMVMME
jgi:L-iditol 2-dehydrogenase